MHLSFKDLEIVTRIHPLKITYLFPKHSVRLVMKRRKRNIYICNIVNSMRHLVTKTSNAQVGSVALIFPVWEVRVQLLPPDID
jgi:hypothetical protein